MEPGHEDREYAGPPFQHGRIPAASMEPGHEDREYGAIVTGGALKDQPQWSPVMKTGNTAQLEE